MQTLKRIQTPNTPLDASRLCLGAGGFGTQLKGDAARHLVADFLEAGGDFFDTAHVYAFWEPNGLGASERELGACLRDLGAIDRVTIATKGGHPDAGPEYRRPDDYLSERVIASDITESLERLGIDRIDLYFLHRDDPRVPVGEIVACLNREIDAARIRLIGVSNWSTERIAEANAYASANGLHSIVASQVQASLAVPAWVPGPGPTMRYITEADADWYAAADLPVVAYSATANGYFSGRGHDRGSFAAPDNEARYERARDLASQMGCTPTQIALAYLLNQPVTIIPLFSTTRREHLKEAVEADVIELTPSQIRWLRDGGTTP
jgi:aryl-alcohol dehydrogenase-like predicted oxidoreductase